MIKIIFSAVAIIWSLSINAKVNSPFPFVEGWDKSKEVKDYDRESLWEYINGAADYYLNYGFERLEVVEYSLSEDIYIKVEIYYHSNKINAFGIYAYERSENGLFGDYGNEGYLVHSALNFYLNNCYVKIHSHNSSEETIETIRQLGITIPKNMHKNSGTPTELDDLPTVGRVLHSEKYIPTNYMGFSFFKSVVSAKYNNKENSFELFCIAHNSNEAAANNLKQYFDFNKLTETPEVNKIYKIEDLFNGAILIVIHDKKIFGVWNATNTTTAKVFLDDLLKD